MLCRAVLKSNVSCRVELYRALLHCRPSRRNPDRTDLGSKLELPEGIARASCNRSARGARPARAQDHIQFRSPRSIHRRPKPDRTDVDLKVELLEARSRRAVGAHGADRDLGRAPTSYGAKGSAYLCSSLFDEVVEQQRGGERETVITLVVESLRSVPRRHSRTRPCLTIQALRHSTSFTAFSVRCFSFSPVREIVMMSGVGL